MQTVHSVTRGRMTVNPVLMAIHWMKMLHVEVPVLFESSDYLLYDLLLKIHTDDYELVLCLDYLVS